MFVNITEKPPWGSVIKAITITITTSPSLIRRTHHQSRTETPKALSD